MAELKREFGGEDNKSAKVVELKRVEQEDKIIEEFIQNFKQITKGSRYKK